MKQAAATLRRLFSEQLILLLVMCMERYPRIRSLREDADLTQTQVGQAINVPQRTYAYYESGQRMIPPHVLCAWRTSTRPAWITSWAAPMRRRPIRSPLSDRPSAGPVGPAELFFTRG